MPLFSQTEERIFSDILLNILEDTNITRTSPGSKTRALVEAVSKKLGTMWQQFDLNMVQAFLDGAEGQFLNLIGDMMGVQRLGETSATISSTDQNVRFYVDSGTFGDINGSNSILITSGTIISTEQDNGGIAYKVSFNTVLSSTDSETYISVQSIKTGSDVNVGAGELTYHNFINYDDSSNNSLKVINDAEIITAQDVEIDTNYRYRISNQVLAAEAANSIAIRLSILSIPGVADLVQLPFHRGIGTYDVLIKSTVPSIPDSLISTIQLAVDNIAAHGINVLVRGPRELGISLIGTLRLRNRISAQEETDLISTVTTNVTDYINNLDIGEEFIVNELVERVLGTSATIKTIGEANKPFDNLYLYTPSRLEDNKIRSTIIQDLTPEEDERIIVENRYAGSTPILFRVST